MQALGSKGVAGTADEDDDLTTLCESALGVISSVVALSK